MEQPEQFLETARRALENGDLDRSVRLCEHLADVPEALLIKGRALLGREGRSSEALAAFKSIPSGSIYELEVIKGEVEAQLRLGQVDAAEARLEDADAPRLAGVIAAVRDPGQAIGSGADVLLLGQTLNALRQFDRAEALFSEALSASPADPALWLARTRALGGLGRIDDILEACRRIRDACFRRPIGLRGGYMAEISLLCRSLDQVRPDHSLTLALLGGVYIERIATELEGRELINRANRADPGVADQYLGAGFAHVRSGNLEEAHAVLQRAANGMAGFDEPSAMAQALRQLVDGEVTLRALGLNDALTASVICVEGLGAARRYMEAVRLSEEAAQGAPTSAEMRYNYASFLSLVGRTEEAYHECLEICRLAPDEPSVKVELASNLMALGRMGEAWDLYDHRLEIWRKDTDQRTFPVPQWIGEPVQGGTLLVWREEGVGDELRGVSALPDLMRFWPGRIIVECDPRWRSTFERSFPDVTFLDEDLAGSASKGIDFHIPVMSLWRLFRRRLEDFPRTAYILPEPALVAEWKTKFGALGTGPKIGIGWKSLNPSWRKAPLLTALSDWDAITGRDDLVMVNLQCDGYAEELAEAVGRLKRPIHHFDGIDLKNDLETTVAIMAALDAVVGARCWVPTTAGAVGTKAFTVSPKPNPFMADQPYDPWSMNGEVIYRNFEEDWTRAVKQVNIALDNFLEHEGIK